MNTKVEQPRSYREKVIDGYGMKLLTSGYDRVQVILLSGTYEGLPGQEEEDAGNW